VCRKYQSRVHNDKPSKLTRSAYKRFLVNNPFGGVVTREQDPQAPECGYGAFHVQWWFGDHLVALCIVDVLPRFVKRPIHHMNTSHCVCFFQLFPPHVFRVCFLLSSVLGVQSHEICLCNPNNDQPRPTITSSESDIHTAVCSRYLRQHKPNPPSCARPSLKSSSASLAAPGMHSDIYSYTHAGACHPSTLSGTPTSTSCRSDGCQC
jgi:hypothetical protein